MESRTRVAVFVDLIRQVLALSYGEALAPEEVRLAREQANAIDPMPLCLGHQRLHELASTPASLCPGCHRDRANLGQMSPVEMQRTASDNAAIVFEDHEVPHVLADLRQRARQQCAVA